MGRFAHTEKSAEVYNRIIKEYREIDCDSKLEALGLEYSDYRNELGLVLDGLRFYGKATTGSERVAKWLESRGCIICRTAPDCWLAKLSGGEETNG